MKSIYRFYKNNKQSFDSLAELYIYLFSAKTWEKDSEFDFDIDIGSDEDFKHFLERKLLSGFKLNLGDEGFEAFKQNRINKLTKYGKKELLNSDHEYAFLLEKLFEEAMSETGVVERRELIKDGFFKATGISCFTSDGMAVENFLHWDTFANAGNGFCVEYNIERLHEYFVKNDLGISWGQISYYQGNKPRLRLPQTDLE